MAAPLPALDRLRFVRAMLLASAMLALACGSSQSAKEAPIARGPHNVDVELPQFEVNGDGVDRFATCPPTGGVTQGWIPNVGAWSPSDATAVAAVSADAGATPAAPPPGSRPDKEIAVTPRPDEPSNAPTAGEKAIRDTLQPFRTCHRRGLLHDATQDGHVAIVVRVGADGRVVKTESHGACELSREVVACMMQVASRLRFDPPAEGSATIILPAVFAPRSGIVRQAPGSHDEYAAAASVSLEGARRGLHDCERRERRAVRSQQAWATFIMDVDDKGRVVRQNLEPWSGNQELLKCASDVMSRLTFPPPVSGSATVRARVSFNPRGILAGE